MFDIGFAELLVVAVMALVVLGPEKLPTAARTLGLWIGRIRRSLGSIQREISEELRVDELRRTTAVSKQQVDKELKEMSQPFSKPFGEDSPAQKAAQDAPKAEFDPAQFTSDESVVNSYKQPSLDAESATVDSQVAEVSSQSSDNAGVESVQEPSKKS